MEKTTQIEALQIALLTKFCSGDQITKNEISGSCRKVCGRGELLAGFWWEKLRKRGPRRRWVGNIKMDLQEEGWGLEMDPSSIG